MNYKMIGRVLGWLFLLEAAFMLPPAGISFFQGEENALRGLLMTIALLLLTGAAFLSLCWKAKKEYYAREGFLIVAVAWVVMSLFGGLPFFFSGEIPSLVDCFFETVSGFTTTGASILTNVEAMSHGLLFWRSFTHWLGGMGILVFLLAIVPGTRGAGHSLHLMRAESPGPSVGKLVPKTRQTAKILYSIYIFLTVLCVIFLLVGGMPLFDSLCTAFGTAGTGGFGVKNDSLASYSPYLQNVCTIFMALFGVNFSVYFMLLVKDWRRAWKDEELRAYFGIMAAATLIITLNIRPLFENSFFKSLHHAAFQVSSVMTTTGFATTDFDLWPHLSRGVLMVLMVLGASAGSTGGGIKTARVVLLLKKLRLELQKILRPRSVRVLQFNGTPVTTAVMDGVTVYMAAYCFIGVLSFLLISIDNFSLETNLSAMLACFNNIGPGLGMVGPVRSYAGYSDLSKLVLSLDMLLGRLEIFPILALLSPRSWSRKA